MAIDNVLPIRADSEFARDFYVRVTALPADKKVTGIKLIREASGLGLKEAKDLVESLPALVKVGSSAKAETLIGKIEEQGGTCAIELGRTVAAPDLTALIGRIDGVLHVIQLYERSLSAEEIPALELAYRELQTVRNELARI